MYQQVYFHENGHAALGCSSHLSSMDYKRRTIQDMNDEYTIDPFFTYSTDAGLKTQDLESCQYLRGTFHGRKAVMTFRGPHPLTVCRSNIPTKIEDKQEKIEWALKDQFAKSVCKFCSEHTNRYQIRNVKTAILGLYLWTQYQQEFSPSEV
ncbi:hypothetical protein WISP_53040 [Willisornis vidua]|uniref:Uncharacterized protein n=1 Tax=Willisornis vidua TaxID=1566151 RepID=A0ABQ9DIR6_9PASS|nr:hypothetical protein WISP_53040 [Willisornis vidua]